MLSIPIQITKQEVRDFPLESLQIDSQWAYIIDPDNDNKFQMKKTKKKRLA